MARALLFRAVVGRRGVLASAHWTASFPSSSFGALRCMSTAAAREVREEGWPSHQYHRHSTRYHATSRAVLEQLEEVQNPHTVPETFGDRFALSMVKFLRRLSDYYFSSRLLERACMLETIAAIPGFVAGMHHHLKTLRTMKPCRLIKSTMDEAENGMTTALSQLIERMHLMTFLQLANLSWAKKMVVLLGQGVFLVTYSLFYACFPRTAHRFVGYLEEEAVHTYTEVLRRIDNGDIENCDAPEIAKHYWNMPEDATLRDVVLVVRADECDHRMVNHHISDLYALTRAKRAAGDASWQACDDFEVDLSGPEPPRHVKQ